MIFLLLINLCTHLLYAEYATLDSIRLTENFTFKQKVIVHYVKVPNAIVDSMAVVEFAYKESLYIISAVFNQDYNEYMQEYLDVPSLVRKILSTYPTECSRGDCGYTFTYDSDLPSTLTLYTFPNMDTIQYVTTSSPQLHMAVIQDTILGSSNIRCGVSLNNLFGKLFVDSPCYYDYNKYRNIVFVPASFDNSLYKRDGYLTLLDACFVIENKNGIISKIEIRQTDYFNKKTIMQDLEFY